MGHMGATRHANSLCLSPEVSASSQSMWWSVGDEPHMRQPYAWLATHALLFAQSPTQHVSTRHVTAEEASVVFNVPLLQHVSMSWVGALPHSSHVCGFAIDVTASLGAHGCASPLLGRHPHRSRPTSPDIVISPQRRLCAPCLRIDHGLSSPWVCSLHAFVPTS